MLSLYRAWLGPGPHVARPAPPPGAHRPVPRRARPVEREPSPCSSASSELDVERVEPSEPLAVAAPPGAVLDVASCDGPVRFSRVLNEAWSEAPGALGEGPAWPARARRAPRASVQYYPCKSCGCKFPSYYFVHKHRKRCHADEEADQPEPEPEPEPSTSAA